LNRLVIRGILSVIRRIIASGWRIALSGSRGWWRLLHRRLLSRSQISIGGIIVSNRGGGSNIAGLSLSRLVLRSLFLSLVASTQAYK
jgi:hypothetical protein